MEKNPAVSVVVPVYKVEPYVKQCVDSILEQTFQDFEIILVDDASPDNSFELCKKLYGKNEKVRFIRHEKNLGLGPARNTGMKNSRGKYICFVDSDDFIMPRTLKTFYEAAERTNAQIVHAAGRYELIQDEPEPVLPENIKMIWDKHSKEGFLVLDVVQRLERNWMLNETWTMAWLCFCRRDFLEENYIEFLPMISEDEVFNFTLLCTAERYYILHEALYVYRRRTGSIINSNSLEKFSKVIQSFIIGANYIENLFDCIPRFENYDLWHERIMNEFFNRFSNHTKIYYEDLNISLEKNDVVKKSLTPFFGENEAFVRFFFNGSNFYHRQAEILLEKYNQISEQVMSLFERIELANQKIVFVNFMGKGYSCNPKYIAQEILRQNLPFDLVWLVNDLNEPMPEKIRKVQYGSVDSVYELATAKVIVTNTKNLLPFPNKKPGQYFIMTWHGSPAFKSIEKDAEKNLSPTYVKESKLNSAITDLMLTNSQEHFEEIRRAFWYRGEILKCGLPRNDIFFNHSPELVANIKRALNVSDGNKIIIYAPTFRDDVATLLEAYKFNAKKLLQAVTEKFGGKWSLLIRLHPNVSRMNLPDNFFGDSENIINATNYPDIQEIIIASDILISDYSSLIYDFMISRKPVFIFAKDFDTYPKERGFKQLYFDLPYKINRTEDELFACIESFDKAALEPAIKNFLDKLKPFDTGHASEAVVERIKEVIENQMTVQQYAPPLYSRSIG